MKAFTLSICFLLSAVFSLLAGDLVAGGVYYSNAIITSYVGDDVVIQYSGGQVKVPWSTLSKESQDFYAQNRTLALAKQPPKPGVPSEVVLTRSLKISGENRGGDWFAIIPFGSKLQVLSVAGLYLEAKWAATPMLVPIEFTDYLSRNAPSPTTVPSATEQARLSTLIVARPAF